MPRRKAVTLVGSKHPAGQVVPIPSVPVRVDAVFHVRSIHPNGDGPWSDEPDKVAWVDPMSGLPCIIRRKPVSGVLGGYVAVPPDHPLFGWEPEATIGLGMRVHGGVMSYAASCERTAPEEVSICHVLTHPIPEERLYTNDAARRLEPARQDDAWWFGFECGQEFDVQPGVGRNYAHPGPLDGVNRREYRDMGYVYRECVGLAAQMKAIGEGRDPASAIDDVDGAVGYDPLKATR